MIYQKYLKLSVDLDVGKGLHGCNALVNSSLVYFERVKKKDNSVSSLTAYLQ